MQRPLVSYCGTRHEEVGTAILKFATTYPTICIFFHRNSPKCTSGILFCPIRLICSHHFFKLSGQLTELQLEPELQQHACRSRSSAWDGGLSYAWTLS